MNVWIYIALLLVLGILAVGGQYAYTRALQKSGVAVPKVVTVVRIVNLSLLALSLVAVIIYLVRN